MMLVHDLLREDLIEFLKQRQTSRFHSEHFHDLVNVIRRTTRGIHTRKNRKLLEIGTIHVQNLERLGDLATHTPITHQLVLDFAELQTTHIEISRDHHLQEALLHTLTQKLNADLVCRQELEANRKFTLGLDESTRDLNLVPELDRKLLRLQTSLNLRHIQHTATNELGGIQLNTNDPRTARAVVLD